MAVADHGSSVPLASEPLEPQAGHRILARVAEAAPPLRIRPVVPGFEPSMPHYRQLASKALGVPLGGALSRTWTSWKTPCLGPRACILAASRRWWRPSTG